MKSGNSRLPLTNLSSLRIQFEKHDWIFMQFEGQHYSSKLSFGVAVVLKESERGRSLFCMIMSVSLVSREISI